MRSFTLIEIMVALVIFALLIAAFGIFGVGNRAYNTDVRLLSLQQGARRAMNLMIRELRETNDDPAGGNFTFNSLSNITFNIPPDILGNPWVGPIRYNLNDGNHQIIRTDPNGIRILANNIDFIANGGLSFIPRINPVTGTLAIVEIEITAVDLQRPGPADDLQFFLRERVSLRN